MNYVITDDADNVICIVSDEDDKVVLMVGYKYFKTDRLVLRSDDNGAIKAYDATLHLIHGKS